MRRVGRTSGEVPPVADLYEELQDKVYLFIQDPGGGWDPAPPSDDEKQRIFDQFARAISARAQDIAAKRIRDDRRRAWQEGYGERGTGSSFRRASIIKEKIYEKAAPIPSIAPAPSDRRNRLLHYVTEAVSAAAEKCDVVLR